MAENKSFNADNSSISASNIKHTNVSESTLGVNQPAEVKTVTPSVNKPVDTTVNKVKIRYKKESQDDGVTFQAGQTHSVNKETADFLVKEGVAEISN